MAGGITIYHNPECGTSRTVLASIEAAGFQPEVVLYLEAGWTRDGLTRLLERALANPRDWLRVRNSPAEELGLTAPDTADEAIFEAMLVHPVLVDRPVVETPKGVKLCRPAETVLELL
ncbi:Arsenate reductase [Alphaproteobacteria bacterium SO-S41]|nr:Arsenate reductase [Alphaproteobacteria bacterium SO-S41]